MKSMKKVWLSAAAAVAAVAGLGSTVWGEEALRIFLNGNRVQANMPASSTEQLKEVINRMGAFVNYDKSGNKMEIVKPNVNILVLEGIQQTKNKTIVFSNPINGYTDKDVPRTFNVFVEVDQAPVTRDLEIRLDLVGPDGKVVERGKEWKFSTQKANSFYFSEPFVSTKLDKYGTYKVQVRMKYDKQRDFVTVGENSFTVGRR